MRPIVRDSDIDWEELDTDPGVYRKDLVTTAQWGAMSVHYVRIPPGNQLSVHAHNREAETHFVISGHGTGRIANEEYKIAPGDTLMAEPGVAHSVTNLGQEDLVLLCVYNPPLV